MYGLQRELLRAPVVGAERSQALFAWLEALGAALPGSANRVSMRRLRSVVKLRHEREGHREERQVAVLLEICAHIHRV